MLLATVDMILAMYLGEVCLQDAKIRLQKNARSVRSFEVTVHFSNPAASLSFFDKKKMFSNGGGSRGKVALGSPPSVFRGIACCFATTKKEVTEAMSCMIKVTVFGLFTIDIRVKKK
ncbi:hypothetical protein [Paenibacillus tyrfis]|uniref:hypothetical protein n=1 Tax=Paenibacillus tyrfis TaxID=1501230 RepID=UPI0020A22BA9|nr:hypothetical protein [Paenibacillus tyrfis]MCP1308667.1 hypothetical protein [Paenibacillus tyrfis]